MDHHVELETLELDGGVQKLLMLRRRRRQQLLVRERGRRIKAAAELGLARSSRGRQWGRALGRRALLAPPLTATKGPGLSAAATLAAASPEEKETKQAAAAAAAPERRGEVEEEAEEEVVVGEKVAQLRQLVPGGEEMAVEGLLEETADYIAALKAQVGVMRALACLLSGSGLDAPPEKAPAALLAPEKPL
ncbi:hypothetical protein ACP4OV_027586 [Aristida adscensionis]